MKEIRVIHGPNLNLLGLREPGLYGKETLAEIDLQLQKEAVSLGFSVVSSQHNDEVGIIEAIHRSRSQSAGLIINAAAFTHTSIAIRDALLACESVFVEIHLTNLAKREQFRHNSYLTDIALGSIMGFGAFGYVLALRALVNHLRR
jgi:3-dehydroquinate dehydratase-2